MAIQRTLWNRSPLIRACVHCLLSQRHRVVYMLLLTKDAAFRMLAAWQCAHPVCKKASSKTVITMSARFRPVSQWYISSVSGPHQAVTTVYVMEEGCAALLVDTRVTGSLVQVVNCIVQLRTVEPLYSILYLLDCAWGSLAIQTMASQHTPSFN